MNKFLHFIRGMIVSGSVLDKQEVRYRFSSIGKGHISRAGIIPYCIWKNQIYILMGIDKDSGDLSDFGGGVKLKENFTSAAIREFNEETCGIFRNNITKEHLFKSPVVINKITKDYEYSPNHAIYFVEISNQYLDCAENLFERRSRKFKYDNDCNEMTGLKWLTQDEFRDNIYGKSQLIWSRIKKHILENTTWIDLYGCLYLGIGWLSTPKKCLT